MKEAHMETTVRSPETAVGKKYVISPAKHKNKPVYRFAKRAVDLAVSVVLLLVLLVPMLMVALIIRLDSPGAALFRQERLGKDGKPFCIYKFRTMKIDAEDNGPQWAEKEDPRCTKVGRILRHSRLDELPQLINVLRGEMSLVGPRPERAFFYDEFETYIDGFRYRLAVRPGITGLAQVNGGYDLLPEEKIVYDMEYIEKMSVKMDLYCIGKTVNLVFTHEGAR